MDKIQFVTTSKNKIKQATAAPLVDLKFPPFGWSTFSIQEGRNRCLLLHSCSILEIDKTFSPFFWCKCMLAPCVIMCPYVILFHLLHAWISTKPKSDKNTARLLSLGSISE